LQLIVIKPLGYRLRKGSKVLYRGPAFLLCTDGRLAARVIIETYFQRWEIEVDFREEKTILGVGQAQVRAERSAQTAPALTVASYAMLLLAAGRAFTGARDARFRVPNGTPLRRISASPLSRWSINCAPRCGAAGWTSTVFCPPGIRRLLRK
jgi:hypothetical protein